MKKKPTVADYNNILTAVHVPKCMSDQEVERLKKAWTTMAYGASPSNKVRIEKEFEDYGRSGYFWERYVESLDEQT
jgi:hypothetical protein